MQGFCYKCQTGFEPEPTGKVSRSSECTSCKASLRCCKMCRFYDATAYNECHEPVAERIVDKEKSNFCEYFMVSLKAGSLNSKEQLMADAMSLFKKKD